LTTVCQHRSRYCPEDGIEGNIIQSKILSENLSPDKKFSIGNFIRFEKTTHKRYIYRSKIDTSSLCLQSRVDSTKITPIIDSSY
jgi:hypothetical protein